MTPRQRLKLVVSMQEIETRSTTQLPEGPSGPGQAVDAALDGYVPHYAPKTRNARGAGGSPALNAGPQVDLSLYRHKPARRTCLRCRKNFNSQHACNRLCPPCNRFVDKCAPVAGSVVA